MSAILVVECDECGEEIEGTDLETKGQLKERAAAEGWSIAVKRPDLPWTKDEDRYDYCAECSEEVDQNIADWEEEQRESEAIEAERAANPPKTN